MSEDNGDEREIDGEREIGGEPGNHPGGEAGDGPVADGQDERPGLDALVQAREDAERALELGEYTIEYRGWEIGLDEYKRGGVVWGWEYVFNGSRRGEPLEDIFEEIDEAEGSSQEEIEALSYAWDAHREVRGLRTDKPVLYALLQERLRAIRATEEGKNLIKYRGRSFRIEEDEESYECVYNDTRYPSMEDTFDAIDLGVGFDGLEAEELERAWSKLSVETMRLSP